MDLASTLVRTTISRDPKLFPFPFRQLIRFPVCSGLIELLDSKVFWYRCGC